MRPNSTSDVSIKLLQSIFQEQVEHKHDNKDRTELIVEALGGINNILGMILNSNDDNIMNDKQKQLLYQTLSAPTTSHNDMDNNDRIELVLDSSDNYLFKWFGDRNNDISLKIHSFIHHRVIVSLIVLLWLIWWILLFTVKAIIWQIFFVFFSILIWIPFLILYAASVNRVAFKKIIRKTDFWIKMFYINKFIVCLLWFWFATNKKRNRSLSFGLLATILACIGNNIVLLIISSFDGFKGSRKTKLVWSTFAGLIFFLFFIFCALQSYSNGDESVIVIYGDIKISLLSSMSSSAQIIAIFMFKQCFLSFYFKKQSVSIVYRPFIVWKQQQQLQPRDIENKMYYLMQTTENNISFDKQKKKELIINS